MPRVTVGLAVYNGARTLPATLASIGAQTFRDFDVLVVDDGSTDGSGDMAEEHGCTVVRQSNQGLGAARKRLVEEAQGDLIAFIDADDTWTPEKLSVQVEALDGSGAALVHSDCWYEYEDGRTVERTLALPSSASAFDHIIPSNLVVASSALFDRESMLQAGNFVADTVRCSDWYGWFVLARGRKFLHLPKKQVRYHVLSTSLANAGHRFHEAQRFLLEDLVLPRFEELFEGVPSGEKERYRKQLRRTLGVAYSSLGRELLREGRSKEARAMAAKAMRLAPGVFRVWTRALRARLG